MSKYSTEERTLIVQWYFESHGSNSETQRCYRRHFNTRDSPSVNAIKGIISLFQEQGAVCDLPRSGRPRTARNDENREELERSLEENPPVSTRRRSQQMGISRSSLQRMLHEMDMFPYKIQLVQQLQPQDYEQRLEYAMRLQDLVNGDPGFLQTLIMSDETHFHLNGFVNKQNCRIWGTENPQVIQQHQLHPVKCTVWCGVTANEIIGPYFFEDEEGNQVAVTGARYRTMIQDFLEPWVQAQPEQMWFQQDGATAHTARETIQMLQNIFQDRIISRGCEINWPPRSPDLTIIPT